MELTAALLDPAFTTATRAGGQQLLENLVGYYIIMEGIFFYTGFAMVLSLHRRNLMTGIGEQFQYILRDETVHLNFGVDLINGVKAENPRLWTPAFQRHLSERIDQAVELEIAYAVDCLPRGALGLTSDLFRQYVGHIADRRLERIGLPPRYGTPNPFPWMSETIDLSKEKNFFETRVTEYQSATALRWDETGHPAPGGGNRYDHRGNHRAGGPREEGPTRRQRRQQCPRAGPVAGGARPRPARSFIPSTGPGTSATCGG
jgi:ribonucleoside-diphosphate reductase beta chain